MSLFDSIKGHKNTTQNLVGVASINERYLGLTSGKTSVYLIISPVNLNVLSNTIIQAEVDNLSKAVKEIGKSEIIAINSAQNYEHNKRYLSQQLLREKNDTVKNLDQQDIEFLDDIQVRMATSRVFLLRLSFSSNESLKQISTELERAKQTCVHNGFTVRPAEKRDIKRLLSIYWEQNIYEEEMQDFDGERYSPILEVKK